jgi:hypothetical protein
MTPADRGATHCGRAWIDFGIEEWNAVRISTADATRDAQRRACYRCFGWTADIDAGEIHL